MNTKQTGRNQAHIENKNPLTINLSCRNHKKIKETKSYKLCNGQATKGRKWIEQATAKYL